MLIIQGAWFDVYYIMDDELGPKLQDLDLPVRKRIRKEK